MTFTTFPLELAGALLPSPLYEAVMVWRPTSKPAAEYEAVPLTNGTTAKSPSILSVKVIVPLAPGTVAANVSIDPNGIDSEAEVMPTVGVAAVPLTLSTVLAVAGR